MTTPEEKEKCKAELHLRYRPNTCTMVCQLLKGHEGPHKKEFHRNGPVVISFHCDERPPAPEPCPSATHMGEHACSNKHQCWEPCGELGKDEDYVSVAPDSDAPGEPV